MLKNFRITRNRLTVSLLLASACLTTAAIAGTPQSGVEIGQNCCNAAPNLQANCRWGGCQYIHPGLDQGFWDCLNKAIAVACPAQAN